MKQGSTNLVICEGPPGYLQLEVIPPLPKGSVRPKRCQRLAYGLWLMAHGLWLFEWCGRRSAHSNDSWTMIRKTGRRSPLGMFCARQRHRIQILAWPWESHMLFLRPSRSIGAQKTGLVYHVAEISGSQGFASHSSVLIMTNV